MKYLVSEIYKSRNKFILIGLTGKTGSGCSTVASILNNGYVEYKAVNEQDKYIQQKKDRVIKNFASKNFEKKDRKFYIVKPSTIIIMIFLFEKRIFFQEIKVLVNLLNKYDDIKNKKDKKQLDSYITKIKQKCSDIIDIFKVFTSFNSKDEFRQDENFLTLLKEFKIENKNEIIKLVKEKKEQREQKLAQQTKDNLVNEINEAYKINITSNDIKDFKYTKIDTKYTKKDIEEKLKLKHNIVKSILERTAKNDYEQFINLYERFNNIITKKRKDEELSISTLQNIGDLVRRHIHIFELPEYTNYMIKALRAKAKNEDKSCYIVIDSIKNPFEIVYFKERYSAYYTFSIHAKDENIYKRFKDRNIDIQKIHEKELYKLGSNEKQKESLDSEEDFNSQNIIECIQRSDIYIDNNKDKKDNLYKQIFKYLSLIIHPGLITPTKDEIFMQLALNAKFNSGCISRQVGAVVLNKYDSIKSVGWNEVPEGQIPCNLRNHSELLNNSQLLDYSEYEKQKVRNQNAFKYIFTYKSKKEYIEDNNPFKESNNIGLPDSFCFKQVQNNIDENKNQVYTRSLHAEENAFLQLAKYGNNEIIDGQLFTTASPCFLCAKKAYQLGIRRIVYIEAYPDISNNQIFACGFKKTEIVHFRGAIGLAYQKLYEPLFSYKDELKAINTQQNFGDNKKP